MNMENFKSPQEMINWLMSNEGSLLKDGYGRQWMYKKYQFWFKDIGLNDILSEGLECLHLFETINIPTP